MFRGTFGGPRPNTPRETSSNKVLWRDFCDAAVVLLVKFKCLICIFLASHFESLLLLSQMKALLLRFRLFKETKPARHKEHPRHLLCTNKTFTCETVCKFDNNDTFYLVIRAGPPSRSCLSHLVDCFTHVFGFTSSYTWPVSSVQFRNPPKK